MKLPVGIQSFEKIRTQNFIYVDKTEYIYQLAHNNVPYFLSRPRRFGKSLLLSTMKAYWEGRRDLFQGLKIEELENRNPEAWQKYPVFCFDFNGKNYQETNALEDVLQAMLAEWGEEYGVDPSLPIEMQFKQLLKKAHEKTGKRCVVLVDEYDKPLLETLEKKNLTEHNKALFKGFFSNLKSEDAHLQFVFITGVTKFSKVSIFSDLNQLHDISLVKEYAGLCGISRTELEEYFAPEIEALAKEQGDTREKCLERLRQRYDGYRFHEQGCGIFNPYSILTAFADKEFGAYWFATGTPGFLVKRLKEISFDVRKFTDGTLYASKRMLSDYRDDNPDPIPLLYQTGYLTLKEYIREREVYILGFPNEEVKYAFLESMLPVFVDGVGAGSGKDIYTLAEYVETGDLEGIRKVYTALFASIPYTTTDDPFEHDFQTVIYITLTLLGRYVACEMHTSEGRIDCVLETKQYVYLFEFKRDSDVGKALTQIKEKHYADRYAADPRKLYRIGVNFSSSTRQMEGWKVEQ